MKHSVGRLYPADEERGLPWKRVKSGDIVLCLRREADDYDWAILENVGPGHFRLVEIILHCRGPEEETLYERMPTLTAEEMLEVILSKKLIIDWKWLYKEDEWIPEAGELIFHKRTAQIYAAKRDGALVVVNGVPMTMEQVRTYYRPRL